MPGEDVPVVWEVGTSEDLATTVASGVATASPDHAHTVHVDVTGLTPATTYWYRFRVGPHTSTTGRTVTMPATDGPASHPGHRPRVLPALRDRALRGPPGHRRGAARRPRLPGRLHLRGPGPPGRSGRGDPQSQRRRADRPPRLPRPLRAVPHRRGPAGVARVDRLVRHLGRPRGPEQLRRRPQHRSRHLGGRLPRSPGRRVPGLVGAPAGAPAATHERRLPDLPLLRARLVGPALPARWSPVPQRPGLRRPRFVARAGLPRDVRARADDARRRAGAVAARRPGGHDGHLERHRQPDDPVRPAR